MAIATRIPTSVTNRYDIWTIRSASPNDVEALVDIDMDAFDSVYREGDRPRDELKADLMTQFAGRIAMLDPKWTQIASKNGVPTSFIMACPTDKPPETFSSWEQTTNNGTLLGTHNPDGRFLYVVSLSSRRGGGDQLMDRLIGYILKDSMTAYFESRLPGLRTWAIRKARDQKIDFNDLRVQEDLAKEYFSSRGEDGKHLDPLLKMYAKFGCDIPKLIPNAYQDPKSLNFGALCIFRGDLPYGLHRNALTRKAAGFALIAANKAKLKKK